MSKQTQHHAGQQGEMFPLEGEILPHEKTYESVGELEIFEASDVEQAIRIFKASAEQDPQLAMREVMMYTLKIAAINLGVHG